jgi:UDP-glucose 4-epimerase
VSVLDDLSTGRLENIEHLQRHPRFACTIGSVMDEAVLGGLIERADVVFHLAAAVGVRLVIERPVHTIETNVHGTETVLRTRGATASSCWSPPPPRLRQEREAPFREDADLVMGPPSKTRWGYATSKLLDEFLALGYWKEYQSPVIVVRFFNTVGPRQSARYGMVLPNFVRRALRAKPSRSMATAARRAASPGSATWCRR